MQHNIDFLSIERKDQLEGTYNAAVKELVASIRRVQSFIPESEIEKDMPSIHDLEKKLHRMDDMFGEPRREYLKEIWEVLKNERQTDDGKYFAICEIRTNDDNNEVRLTNTGYSFPQHIMAEEWVNKDAPKGMKYIILEAIEPE